MRKFLSANIPCEAGCKYCFAKWADYNRQQALGFESENVDSDRVILYPCCDGDFFDQVGLVEDVKHYAEFHKKVYVSLSSKIRLTDEKITQLLELHEWLIKADKGFVKFAISLSNRTLLDKIEPATMSYEERIKIASYINSLGLPLSLTIKPVLPFITTEEYDSILKDFSPYLNRVLLGGLYVNKTSSFYADYLRNDYDHICAKRKVAWLLDHPDWDYVEDAELIKKIKISAQKLGMQAFDSDSSVVKSLIEGAD